MQEVFAIPVIDEIKMIRKMALKIANNKKKIVQNDVQNDEFISDEDIQNIDIDDLDKLFEAKEIAWLKYRRIKCI